MKIKLAPAILLISKQWTFHVGTNRGDFDYRGIAFPYNVAQIKPLEVNWWTLHTYTAPPLEIAESGIERRIAWDIWKEGKQPDFIDCMWADTYEDAYRRMAESVKASVYIEAGAIDQLFSELRDNNAH